MIPRIRPTYSTMHALYICFLLLCLALQIIHFKGSGKKSGLNVSWAWRGDDNNTPDEMPVNSFVSLDKRWIDVDHNFVRDEPEDDEQSPGEGPEPEVSMPGWSVSLASTIVSQKCSVLSRKNDIIASTRLELSWDELWILKRYAYVQATAVNHNCSVHCWTTCREKEWPGAPIHPELGHGHEHFFATFEGNLKVSRSGKYEFSLRSDDGSLLFIDDDLVRKLVKMI